MRIILGELDPPLNIGKSQLDQSRNTYTSNGMGFQAALQVAPLTALGVLFRFTKVYTKCGLVARFTPCEDFYSLIDQLYSKRVIIYVDKTKTAFLCTLIHLIVLLVRVYLRKNHYESKPDQFNWPLDLENAQAGIRELGEEILHKGFTIEKAFQTVTYRYSSLNSVLSVDARCTSTKILGFEVSDILENDQVCPRILPVKNRVETWRLLATNTDVVVCDDIGDVLKLKDASNLSICSQKQPVGSNILVCPLPLLIHYFDSKEDYCYQQRGRKNFKWVPEGNPFECGLKDQCDSTRCWKTRLQCIGRGEGRIRRHQSLEGKLGWLDKRGAICFGRLQE